MKGRRILGPRILGPRILDPEGRPSGARPRLVLLEAPLLRACLLAGGLLGAGSAGCGEAPPAPPPTSLVTPATPVDAPIDELAEGELAQGRATAFGLVLPDKLRVVSRSDTRVVALGPPSLEEVASFVRRRVDAKNVVTGPSKTLLEGVVVKPVSGDAALPTRADGRTGVEEVMRIDIERLESHRTRLVVSRTLLAKVPEGLSEDQRWEKLGIRKDGKPADPKKFE